MTERVVREQRKADLAAILALLAADVSPAGGKSDPADPRIDARRFYERLGRTKSHVGFKRTPKEP